METLNPNPLFCGGEQPWHEQFCQNPSARAEWHLAGIIDGVLYHWGRTHPRDGGPGDHDDADSETDRAIPDDDIGSLANCSFGPSQPSSL